MRSRLVVWCCVVLSRLCHLWWWCQGQKRIRETQNQCMRTALSVSRFYSMVLPASSPLNDMARRAESAFGAVQCMQFSRGFSARRERASERRVPRDRVRDEKGERRGGKTGRKVESIHRNPGRDRTDCCTLLRYPDVSSSGRSPAQGIWNLFIARWMLLLIVKVKLDQRARPSGTSRSRSHLLLFTSASWPWSSFLVLGGRRREKRRDGMHDPLFVHLFDVFCFCSCSCSSRGTGPKQIDE